MRILMVGDIVGKRGRQATLELVPSLRYDHDIDFVIVNGENSAGGIGITPDIVDALLGRGNVQVITLGNHAWGKREIYPTLDSELRLLRPANYPPGAPGRGFGIYNSAAGRVAVISLQGRTFMEQVDDPFRTADQILKEIGDAAKIIVVDFHAEATSEKQAFAWYLDGRVSAIIGTHTHVQTADERILPNGTAFLSDVGMTGPIDSIIGMRTDIVIPKFLSGLPARFEVAEGDVQLCAALLDIDEETGRARSITRIQSPPHRANLQI